MLLERTYTDIHRKLLPGPRRYRSIADLDAEIAALKQTYHEQAANTGSSIPAATIEQLLESFLSRVIAKKTELEYALARKPVSLLRHA